MSLQQYREEVLLKKGKRTSQASSSGRRGKYNNKKTEVDGIIFDSKWEATRYSELKVMLKAKMISGLELQIPYRLEVNDVLIATYRADFVYKSADGDLIVEDAKGHKTAEYKIKRNLMKAIHGIEIYETYKYDKKK